MCQLEFEICQRARTQLITQAAMDPVAHFTDSGGLVHLSPAMALWGLLFLIICTTVVLLAIVLCRIQDSFIYMPSAHREDADPRKRQIMWNPPAFRDPQLWSMPYEEVRIVASDGVALHGWLFLQQQPQTRVTFIFFHENAGNIGFRLPVAHEFYYRCAANVFLLEYRGYGNSEGTPSEAGLQRDGQAALDFVTSHAQLDRQTVFLVGRSLGGAVAVHVASQNNGRVRGIILENTFQNIVETAISLARNRFGNWANYLRSPLELFLTSKWRSDSRIREVCCPILFVSGQCDELIPPEQMQTLYESATQSAYKQLFVVPGGCHNNTWVKAGGQYFRVINLFVDHVLVMAGMHTTLAVS